MVGDKYLGLGRGEEGCVNGRKMGVGAGYYEGVHGTEYGYGRFEMRWFRADSTQ